jgi:hypothetical protein
MIALRSSEVGPSARVSLCKAARMLGVSPKSIARWARVGVRGVVLPTVRIGGRVFVLNADLDAFIVATNYKPDERTRSAPNVSLTGRRIASAEAALDRAGI